MSGASSVRPRARRASLACALAVAAGALHAPAAPADDRVLADRASGVNGYGGALAWSEQTRRGARAEWRLVVRRGGRTFAPSIPRFRHPVNADLGPRAGGGLVAVYARCERDGCDLFLLDLQSGRERGLGISSSLQDEVAPSAWNGRYAFSRAGVGNEPGPSEGLLTALPLRRLAPGVPFETDLKGRRIAYASARYARDFTLTRIVVKRFDRSGRGRRCVVARARDDSGALRSAAKLFSPVLRADFVYWLTRRYDPRTNATAPVRIHRRRVPSARCRSRGPDRVGDRRLARGADSLAILGDRFFYTDDNLFSEEGSTELTEGRQRLTELTDPPLRFRR